MNKYRNWQVDGRWEVADTGQTTFTMPEGFIKLLKKTIVWEKHQSLNKANKYTIVFNIAMAIGEEKKIKNATAT